VTRLIWHKAASPPHSDGSVVLARLRQCAPHLVHPQSASAPYLFCPLLSRFEYIDCRIYPGMSWPVPFRPQNCPFTCGDLDPILFPLFFGSTQVHIPNAISIDSAVFAGLTVVTDRQTDRPHYFVCNNRSYLASAAMRPDNNTRLSSNSKNTKGLFISLAIFLYFDISLLC